MKKIQITRNIFTDKSTIGDLFFDGEWVCATLEDSVRRIKEYGKTAIPSGEYKIELRHSNKFNRMMPFLLDVPYYEGVMIHWGNEAEATLGCILVGVKEENKADWISSSRKTFEVLYSMIEGVIKGGVGEEIWVSILGGIKKEDFVGPKIPS